MLQSLTVPSTAQDASAQTEPSTPAFGCHSMAHTLQECPRSVLISLQSGTLHNLQSPLLQ